MSTRRSFDDIVLVVVGAALVAFALLAGGGLASALISGHGLPTHHVEGAITAFAHFDHPTLAWKVAVGPAWLYWSTTVTLIIGGTVLTVFCAKYLQRDQRRR